MPCGNSRALEEEERPLLLLGKDSADERPRISVYCSLHNFLFLSIIFFSFSCLVVVLHVDHKGCRP